MSEDYARLGLTGDSIELKVWDKMTEKEKADAVQIKAISKELSTRNAELVVRVYWSRKELVTALEQAESELCSNCSGFCTCKECSRGKTKSILEKALIEAGKAR